MIFLMTTENKTSNQASSLDVTALEKNEELRDIWEIIWGFSTSLVLTPVLAGFFVSFRFPQWLSGVSMGGLSLCMCLIIVAGLYSSVKMLRPDGTEPDNGMEFGLMAFGVGIPIAIFFIISMMELARSHQLLKKDASGKTLTVMIDNQPVTVTQKGKDTSLTILMLKAMISSLLLSPLVGLYNIRFSDLRKRGTWLLGSGTAFLIPSLVMLGMAYLRLSVSHGYYDLEIVNGIFDGDSGFFNVSFNSNPSLPNVSIVMDRTAVPRGFDSIANPEEYYRTKKNHERTAAIIAFALGSTLLLLCLIELVCGYRILSNSQKETLDEQKEASRNPNSDLYLDSDKKIQV